MRRANILNLALTDQGGAGLAARGFNDILVAAGHNSILLVKESELANPNVVVLDALRARFSPQVLARKVRSRLSELSEKYSPKLFDDKYCFYNTDEGRKHISIDRILRAAGFEPDVIILHWVSGFVSARMIGELATRTHAKIVWLMMDNAPLTGGCHYPWECTGYQADCAGCPAILTRARQAVARQNLGLKKQHLPNDIRVLACSESDYVRAMSSSLFAEKQIFKYLIPVDSDRYCPGDAEASRRLFGVDPGSRVILYGSISLGDKRKGGALFLSTLRRLQEIYEAHQLERIVVLVAGRAEVNAFDNLGITVKLTGYLDEERLIRAYQAADVFVSTSLEDSGPLMINQSVMCGTPVVAFDVGVALDLVDGTTGYRARTGDVNDLTQAIRRLLDLPSGEYRRMREHCRALAIKMCDPGTQIEKLMHILDSV